MNECLTTPQHEKQIGYWVSEKGKCMKWLLTVNEDKCSTTFRYLVTKYPWSYIFALHVSVYFAGFLQRPDRGVRARQCVARCAELGRGPGRRPHHLSNHRPGTSLSRPQ